MLAERWDGSSWSIQATPSSEGSLSAISCVSAWWCEVVGAADGALAVRWDGATWSQQVLPEVRFASLVAVACPERGVCTAVGTFSKGPLAERLG